MKNVLGKILAAALLAAALAGCAGDMKVAESKCAFPQGTGGPCI